MTMPRKGRIVLPHYPHHIVQRSHNRQVVFVDSMDYRYYLATSEEFKAEYHSLSSNRVLMIICTARAGWLPPFPSKYANAASISGSRENDCTVSLNVTSCVRKPLTWSIVL